MTDSWGCFRLVGFYGEKMKKLLAVLALTISTSAYSGKMIDSCESADLVPGKGWVYEKIPCTDLERPIPCSREWTDEKGYQHSEVIPCPPGTKQKTFEQVAREEDAARQKKCGKDFRALRIGMSLERFEECHEALSYVTETVGKGGAVETYRATFYWIHAQDGRIVSYTRRTR